MSATHVAIKRAFEARRKNQEALQAIYTEAEGRDLSADEASKEEAILADLRDLSDKEIELVELADKESRSADFLSQFAGGSEGPEEQEERRTLADVFRSIADVGGRPTEVEFRDDVALVAGTATDGAELVETTLDRNLVDYLQESIGAVQAGARVIMTSSGNPLTIPKVVSHTDVVIEGETDTIARSAPQFGTASIGAFKYAVLVQLSRELLEDAAFPVVPWVLEQATEELGRKLGTDLVTGAGTTEPVGIDLATNVVNSAAVAAWTADELIDIFHAIASPYRQNAQWILNDTTVQAIRKLKDSSGQYLWQPGMAAGVPDMLFGKRVVTDAAVHELGTGNESVIFGDLRRGYLVRMVNGLDVSRSDDFAFDTDMVTFRFVARADGAIIDQNAIAIGENA